MKKKTIKYLRRWPLSILIFSIIALVVFISFFTNMPTDQKILVAIGMFFLGIFAQSIQLLNDGDLKGKDLVHILLIFAGSLTGFAVGENEQVYDFTAHSLSVAVFFILIYSMIFAKRLLRPANKAIILLWNLIFLYLFFDGFSIGQNIVISSIVFGLSIITILNLIFHFDKRYFWEVYFYIWFLVMLVVIGISHFANGNMSFFLNGGQGVIASPLSMFLTGFTFLYIALNIISLMKLVPWPDKHQTFKSKLTEVKKYMKDLADKYDEKPIDSSSLLVIVLFGLFLLINYFYHFVPIAPLLPVLITVIYVIENYIYGWNNKRLFISTENISI